MRHSVTAAQPPPLIPANAGTGRCGYAFIGASGIILAIAAALSASLDNATAQQRRVVNVYNWSDYVDPSVLDAFSKKTGITVRYDTFDSSDTLEAKLLAGQSGYDVVVPTGYFLAREIAAGIFQKLDKSKLPNLVNAWPEIANRLAAYDPGSQYAVNYMWGTTGIGYNVKDVRRILGAGAALDSWDDVFNPDKIAKFKDCGVHILDSSDDVVPSVLRYLHLEPNSNNPADLEKAADVLTKIRPYVRKFHSSEYINALATGEICFALGYSGDIKQAQKRAAQANGGIEIDYAIPKEGAPLWFDNLAIPKDAPHVVEAHELINYFLDPQVAAKNTNFVSYANGDRPSRFIDKAILDDRTIYPDDATMAKLFTIIAHDQKTQRLANRLWTRVKTGE
jgi:putrescine transport system substrate-binding protein